MLHAMAWETLAERIAWIKAHRGLTMKSLANSSGLTDSAIAVALHRERASGEPATFSARTIRRMAKVADVDPVWLETGQGLPEPAASETVAHPTGAVDTQQIMVNAAQMLVKLDGLALPDALVLVHDLRLPQPTVDGYYSAARLRLSRGPITEEVERAAQREVRLAAGGQDNKRR